MSLQGIVDKKYKLELLQLNEKPVGEIKLINDDLVYSPSLLDMSEIRFSIDKFVNDEQGNRIENLIYSEIKGDMYIVVDDEEWFFIDSAKEKADNNGNHYKEVHGYGREYELTGKRITKYKAENRFLFYEKPSGSKGYPYNATNYPSGEVVFETVDEDGFYTGVFNEIENMTAWQLKRDNSGYPIIPRQVATVTRGLDFSDSNLLEAIKKVQEAFGCFIIFSNDRTIEIKMASDLAQHSGVLLSDKNFIESLEKEIVTENIRTRISIFDKDGRGIAEKMPHGKNYIENYSWFMNTKYMSTHLINALDAYILANNQYHSDISVWWEQYYKAIDEKTDTELVISKLKRELLPHATTVDVLETKKNGTTLEDGTVIPPSPLTQSEIDRLNEAVAEKSKLDRSIKELETGYKTTPPRSLPLIDYDIDNALKSLANHSGKFTMIQMFSDYEIANGLDEGSLMVEMEPFIRDETITLDYSASLEEIHQAGINNANNLSKPPIQFDIGVDDFLQLIEYEDIWDMLKLGFAMDIKYRSMDFVEEIILLGYEHSVGSNSLKLKFSNKFEFITDTDFIAKIISRGNATSSKVGINSPSWNSGGANSHEKIGYIHENLKAISAEIVDLYAEKITVEELNAAKAYVESLIALKADIESLTAIYASIQTLKADKIDVTELNAVLGVIEILEAEYARINTLISGNLTAENFISGAITATSGIIANGAITNAMIANLDVAKLNAGDISTTRFRVVSDSGNLVIEDNTTKVFDDTGKERVSLGKNGDDYNLLIRASDGVTVLFGSEGVTHAGITEGSIDDSKVADNANISGDKLNIGSVVQNINDGTTHIESAKVNYDGKSLNVAFGDFITRVEGTETDLNSLITNFTVQNGKISSLIHEVYASYDENNPQNSISKITGITQTIDEISSTVSVLETDNTNTKSQLSTLTQDVSGFKQTVSSTYATKQEVENEIENIELTPGPQGESAYTVELVTSNGYIFKNGVIETFISARVYYGSKDVTHEIDSSRFLWKRISSDPDGDKDWNERNFGGTKEIIVTTDDVHKRATFTCEILEK